MRLRTSVFVSLPQPLLHHTDEWIAFHMYIIYELSIKLLFTSTFLLVMCMSSDTMLCLESSGNCTSSLLQLDLDVFKELRKKISEVKIAAIVLDLQSIHTDLFLATTEHDSVTCNLCFSS